mmetsp:Transcript_13949/g.56139  ORF Transcript_13949/g.56139 Transcript_13949/m.56139 type:complete len:236 (+) Transcript_13949:990-1697(+)
MFVATITIGLVIAAEQPDVPSDSYATVINGVIFTLTSCLFYSLNYVVVEYFLSKSSGESTSLPPPTGPELSLYTHGTCLLVFCIYVSIHTVPHWTQLVTKTIETHHGSSYRILGLYFGIFASSFLHAIAYYDVIASLGAVYIGIMGAVRSVSVFAASAMFFCQFQVSIYSQAVPSKVLESQGGLPKPSDFFALTQESQCYSPRKGMVTFIVTSGAVGYSLAGRKPISQASNENNL